ncbi:Phosphoinositide phosphatase SAC1 [Acorus calamus]|uniref:Phosphoinositide phosphatase SAC1 n=1 Tax=Acorus calamus TaxID=4465 RepID=A0AAV9EC22_ACOCL|nr:Phosphoinositide phosphatase SAC1 [Acorus calamus]
MAKSENPKPFKSSRLTRTVDHDFDLDSLPSLERFRLYETRARFYLIGCDRRKRNYRVLKIDRSEPSDLSISEDPSRTPCRSIEESQLITVPHSTIQSDVAHSKAELRQEVESGGDCLLRNPAPGRCKKDEANVQEAIV